MLELHSYSTCVDYVLLLHGCAVYMIFMCTERVTRLIVNWIAVAIAVDIVCVAYALMYNDILYVE